MRFLPPHEVYVRASDGVSWVHKSFATGVYALKGSVKESIRDL